MWHFKYQNTFSMCLSFTQNFDLTIWRNDSSLSYTRTLSQVDKGSTGIKPQSLQFPGDPPLPTSPKKKERQFDRLLFTSFFGDLSVKHFWEVVTCAGRNITCDFSIFQILSAALAQWQENCYFFHLAAPTVNYICTTWQQSKALKRKAGTFSKHANL